MYRRSPFNSLPPQVSKRRSPTYPAPRDHRGGSSPPRDSCSPQRFRTRSPSLSRCKNDRSPSQEVSLKRNTRMTSPAGPKLEAFDFEADDEEARQTFCCKHCNVKLHDLVSMDSHLRGKPHLMQQKRLKEHQRMIATGHGIKASHPSLGQVEYNSSAQRILKSDQKRWPDDNSLEKIKPKFQEDRYDQGQFSFKEESFHCEVCNVWVTSRDQMQQHKEGNKHKKKCNEVVRYSCPICRIDVTCKDTLESHMKGGDHMRRAQQQLAEKRRMGQGTSMDEDIVRENQNLKKQVKMLQSKVNELQEYKKYCLDTHEKKQFKELLEHKRHCIENHQRPMELQKPGIHCKKEMDISLDKSTNGKAFKMKRRSYNESDEDTDRKIFQSEEVSDIKLDWDRRLDEDKKDVKLNRRSGEGNRRSFKSERGFDGGGSWHNPNESNEARYGGMEYIENEIDEKFNVESDLIEEHEYVKSETKNESNFDDDIILVE